MKRTASRLSLLPLLCLMTACCPPGTARVNPAVTAPPDLSWEVTKESPDGVKTSATLTADKARVTIPTGWKASVVLKGGDAQTGVKTLRYEGRFYFTCKQAGAPSEMTGDGIIPEQIKEFPADANRCAPIAAAHSPYAAKQFCVEPSQVFVNTGYIFYGEAVNHAGKTRSKQLGLSFTP